MKLKYIFRHRKFGLACAVALLSIMSACGVDRWAEYADQIAVKQWIYDTMQEDYLWYDQIPDSKNLNFFSEASKFLQTLLYKAQDNNYSSTDTLSADTPEYGWEYTLQSNTGTDTYYALVGRVLSDSPAADAGLQRGDWIMSVDGEDITKSNKETLLTSGNAMSLVVGSYGYTVSESGDTVYTVTPKKTVEMQAARSVSDDPVSLYSVITLQNGKRLGYLVYNSFEAGTATDSEKYNNELREASNYFATQGINYLAIDLRHNSGGSFRNSQLLASIVAPSLAVFGSTTYATLTYNDKRTADNCALTYSSDVIGTGSNLSINQGFIITGSGTSASVAGCFLNCLSTFNCWALVGTSLTCWGVATELVVSETLQWQLNPVVCYVANSNGETGAGGSFTPNVKMAETDDLTRYLPLGNTDEALLHAVIELVDR
jgi:hypothetical protein